VGDVDGRDLELREEAAQLLARLLAQLGVKVAQGLVEEDHLRLGDEGAGQGHALLLAAGELRGGPLLEAVELDEAQGPGDLPFDLLPGLVAGLQRVGHVVEDVHVGPDGVGLEHHAEAPPVGRDEEAPLGREDDLVTDGDLARVG